MSTEIHSELKSVQVWITLVRNTNIQKQTTNLLIILYSRIINEELLW